MPARQWLSVRVKLAGSGHAVAMTNLSEGAVTVHPCGAEGLVAVYFGIIWSDVKLECVRCGRRFLHLYACSAKVDFQVADARPIIGTKLQLAREDKIR